MDTKPRISHHYSPGGEKQGKRKHYLIFLEKTKECLFVNQTNIGTVSKAPLGKLLRDRVERIWVFPSTLIYIYIYHLELN